MKSKKTNGLTGSDVAGNFVNAATAQVVAFEKRERSRVEQEYGLAMQRSAIATMELIPEASFEELIQAEKIFQENDLVVYAKRPETLESVQEGIDDINDGMEVYTQLLEDTNAYIAHKYRKKERLLPERIIPRDAMRRALRGQVKRLANYRTNVMGNPREQDFLSARIAMLRRAEKLYDAIQRERLLSSE